MIDITEKYVEATDAIMAFASSIVDYQEEGIDYAPAEEGHITETKKYNEDQSKVDRAKKHADVYVRTLIEIFDPDRKDSIVTLAINKTNLATKTMNQYSFQMYQVQQELTDTFYMSITTDLERNFLKKCITEYFADVDLARNFIVDYKKQFNEKRLITPVNLKSINEYLKLHQIDFTFEKK